MERWRFVADHGLQLPAYDLPPGYTLREMDPSLLKMGISFPQDLADLLMRRRENNNPYEVGFGVVALKDG